MITLDAVNELLEEFDNALCEAQGELDILTEQVESMNNVYSALKNLKEMLA